MRIKRTSFLAKSGVLAAGLGLMACHPGVTTSDGSGNSVAGAVDEATDRDRGPCVVQVQGFAFELREARTFQGTNQGRPQSQPHLDNKYNYGDHFNVVVKVTRSGVTFGYREDTNIIDGFWNKFGIRFTDAADGHVYKAIIDLNPEKADYEVVVELINESTKTRAKNVVTCPNWNDR